MQAISNGFILRGYAVRNLITLFKKLPLVSCFLMSFLLVNFKSAYAGASTASATCTPQAAQMVDLDSCAVYGPAGDSDQFFQVAGITIYGYGGCGVGATVAAPLSATVGSTHMIFIEKLELTSVTDASGTTTSNLTHNIANSVGVLENNFNTLVEVHSSMRLAQPSSFNPSDLCVQGRIASPDQKSTNYASSYSGDTRAKAQWSTDSADPLLTNQTTHLKCTMNTSTHECVYSDTRHGGTPGLASKPSDIMATDHVYPAGQLFWVTRDSILSSRFRGGTSAIITVTIRSSYNATPNTFFGASILTSLNHNGAITNSTHY